ncbi:MAG: ribonuclease Z [Ruminococcaceae bacterium]|nr:ribonuclease Z [Oscillospiraceae bacterium]
MKLYFEGTSHGVPEKDRFCTCTVVEAGGKYYAIDAGGPLVDFLIRRGIHPDGLAAIFITHVHSDHVAGLAGTTDLFTWYFKNTDPHIFTPEQRLLDGLFAWNSMLYGERARHFRSTVFEEGEIFNDGTLRVRAIRTQHTPHSFSFLLEADGKRVLFTGDLKRPEIDFPTVCFEEECDAIVGECAHFPATAYAPIFERCKCKHFYLHHISPRQQPSIDELLAMKKPYTVTPLTDGRTVEV